MARVLTDEEKVLTQELLQRARKAMKEVEHYDQKQVDRLCQAIGWQLYNEQNAVQLVNMAVDESGIGDRVPAKRFKVLGVLRDALRHKSIGIIEELPEKGITKYAKPAGVVCGLCPTTNPLVTPMCLAIYAIKCRDAVIFSPHPSSKKTTGAVVRLMRLALKKAGAPEDLLQTVDKPSIPLAQELMSICDLTVATGGPAMVKSAYGSGKPAFGVGPGNSTMVIDETANIEEAARNTRISKTNDNGAGCSADGNLVVHESIYDALLAQLQKEGGYLCNETEKELVRKVWWDDEGHRLVPTVARPAHKVAELAGFTLPADKTFLIVKEDRIGKEYPFSSEKLGTMLALFKYRGEFEVALDMVRRLYEVGGKGHSCGIYSFNDDHIHRLALVAPVSRMMVRQPQSKANAGSFTNGMPMTSSLGCGFWGGNITNENIHVKHFMNVTWVSRPIPEDRPAEEELFGEFYNSEICGVAG